MAVTQFSLGIETNHSISTKNSNTFPCLLGLCHEKLKMVRQQFHLLVIVPLVCPLVEVFFSLGIKTSKSTELKVLEMGNKNSTMSY